MANAEFFKRQAAICQRLSRTSYDMETSRQLRLMAAEFQQMAEEYESREDFIPGARKTKDTGGDKDPH